MTDVNSLGASGAQRPGERRMRRNREPSPRFWNRVAKGYAAKPVANLAAYEKKLEITRSYLRPEMEVLEIGCGTGTTALKHAPFVKHILATDLSPTMLDIAREKAAAEKVDNVTFQQTSVEALALPTASTDVVMAHSILHLLDDKEAALAKLFAILKPGGLLVSSTVCMTGWMKIFKVIGPIGKSLRLLPTVKVFNAAALERSLRAAGFEIERSWQPENSIAVFIVARKPE